MSTRRNLLTSAAASVMLPGAAKAGGIVTILPLAHPDADLLTACADYLHIQRAFEAYFISLPSGSMANDDPAWAILDPLEATVERIISARATTAEGCAARMRCLAFHHMPGSMVLRDDPDGAHQDRFKAAVLRDLVRDERGGEMPEPLPPVIVTAHSDADLLEACAAFDALERASHATFRGQDCGSPEEEAAEAERERFSEAQEPLVARICELEAITREGMAARARSLALWDGELMKPDRAYTGDRLTAAIIRDLLARVVA
jgi:hypothetical protein